mgnify:CR=1 FL=1
MAVNNADFLFSVLEDYNPKLQELFWVKHPLLDAIVTKKQFEQHKLEGTHRTFGTYTQGPGTVTKISTGNETINGGRKNLGHKGNEYTSRMIYAFDVPINELDAANGKMDIVKLLEKYPEAGMDDFMLRINKQMALGNGGAGEVDGFVTLNGETVYNPSTAVGNRTGIFSFAAPASQTSTVHGIVKQGDTNGVEGWYNQYGDISAFSTDGLYKMRQVYFACSRQGKANRAPDMMFGDELSYLNYLDTLTQTVRTPISTGEDLVRKNTREYADFHDSKFYLDTDIDISNATLSGTPAENGLIYMLQSAVWEFFYYTANKHEEGGSGKPNIFRPRPPFRIPTKDQMRFELVLDANIDCTSLRENGVVTGGAA